MYQKALDEEGIEAVYPDENQQKQLMSLIYDDIKAGLKGDSSKFKRCSDDLNGRTDAVILACTELSVFAVNHELDGGFYIDAMEVLAKSCIETCGGIYSY